MREHLCASSESSFQGVLQKKKLKDGSSKEPLTLFQSKNIEAEVAQLVEQLICNQQVVGSTPFLGSIFMGSYQSGQMGRTVNPLSFDFGGSNPPLPTSYFPSICWNLESSFFEDLCSNLQTNKRK